MTCSATARRICANCHFEQRRTKLETIHRRSWTTTDRSCPTMIPFATWEALTAARADPVSAGAGEDADAVEGVMLKRRDSAYLPGRPKGQWWKWKRDPHDHRRGADVRPARPRQALVLLFGLHLRRLDRARAATSWCRSARPISASPTRSCCRSTASSAATPPKSFGPVRARDPRAGQGAGARSGL